jgi:hypothetical protein
VIINKLFIQGDTGLQYPASLGSGAQNRRDAATVGRYDHSLIRRICSLRMVLAYIFLDCQGTSFIGIQLHSPART